jgi:hypothetical protein
MAVSSSALSTAPPVAEPSATFDRKHVRMNDAHLAHPTFCVVEGDRNVLVDAEYCIVVGQQNVVRGRRAHDNIVVDPVAGTNASTRGGAGSTVAIANHFGSGQQIAVSSTPAVRERTPSGARHDPTTSTSQKSAGGRATIINYF